MLGGMTLAERLERMSSAEISIWIAELSLRAKETEQARRKAQPRRVT